MAIKGDFWAFASWALGSVEGALFERFWTQVAIVGLLQGYDELGDVCTAIGQLYLSPPRRGLACN